MNSSDQRGGPLLEVSHLSKTFGETRALQDFSLDVVRGEVHALCGHNGSGKSTLIKILSGFHHPDPHGDEPVLRVLGSPIAIHSAKDAHDAGLRFVHQQLGLVDSLNTVENLGLGSGYKTTRWGKIKRSAEIADARTRIQAFGYDFDVLKPVGELQAAERTGVAIARALNDEANVRLLVVDEPTAMLPDSEVSQLFEAIRRVQSRGVGVIYVSHRLDEIFEIADRVTVMRGGVAIRTCRIKEIDMDQLVRLMVGDVDLAISHRKGAAATAPVLQVEGLCGTALAGIDFEVAPGEILGIGGLTGSGREEVLPLIFGARPRAGKVVVGGVEIPAGSPRAAMRAGVGYVPSDRRGHASIERMTILENLTLTDVERNARKRVLLSGGRESAEAKKWIFDLSIRPPDPKAVFGFLSGGNQQKVVMAKWLRLSPLVLLLNEPTQGVDVHAKALLHQCARRAADSGAAVVIATSDDMELTDVCDNVIVLSRGVIAGRLRGGEVTSDELVRLQG